MQDAFLCDQAFALSGRNPITIVIIHSAMHHAFAIALSEH